MSVGLLMFAMSLGLSAASVVNPKNIETVTIVQQAGVCQGVILDANGEPLVGASVLVKGSTNGSTTDVNGAFRLAGVKNGATLRVSYIGYKTVDVKWTGSNLNVTLEEDDNTFDEVIVMGYGGSQKRADVTAGVTKMDNQVIANAAFSNVGQALQGSVTGLRVTNVSGAPGASTNIQLRGAASLDGTANALVIVDGIIRNSLDEINSNDIESIQVLKDASATAIYGARANGGVILIQTKSGKKGHAEVNYRFKAGISYMDKGYEYCDAHDYLYYSRLGAKRYNNSIAGYGASFNPDTQQGYGTSNTYYDCRYLEGNENLKDAGWKTMKDPFSGKDLVYQDFGGILDKWVFNDAAFSQDHYLNFSGGNDKGSFNAALGYYSEDGTIQLTNYKRFNGRLSGNYWVFPFLNIKAGAEFTYSVDPNLYINEYNLFYRTRCVRPTWNPVGENGEPLAGFGSSDGNYQYWAGVYDIKNSNRKSVYNIGFDANLWQNKLTLNGNASMLYYDYQKEQFTKSYQQTNQANPNTTRPATANISRYCQLQTNVVLRYQDTFAEKHNVDFMLGGEYYAYNNWAMSGGTNNAPTDDIPTLNGGTVASVSSTSATGKYRILSLLGRFNYNYDMKYLLSLTFREDGVSKLVDNRWGFFPGISFGWNATQEDFIKDSKFGKVVTTLKPRLSYGVNGNVAPLGSYTAQGAYAQTTTYLNNKTFYQSTMANRGLYWERSKTFEAGLDLGFLNNRVSLILDYYNRNTDDLLVTLTVPGYTGFGSILTNLGQLQNQGFEGEIRANLLRRGDWSWDFSANVTTVSNKIIKLPENENKFNRVGGYEVAAGPAKQENGEWKYDTKWVAGRQEGGKLGEIVAYQQDHIFKDWDDVKAHANTRVDQIASLYGPGLADEINPATGKTYKESNGWKPIEPGDVCWEDMDGDNKITSYDKKVIGNYLPKVTGGFSTTVKWKGLSLYARFDYALGHMLYNGYKARVLGQYQGAFNIFQDVKEMWSEDNRDSDMPAYYYADQLAKRNITRENNAGYNLSGNSSRFYEKGDYLALRELTLNYDFTGKWLEKAHMSKLSLYVTGQNLFYVTAYTGNNPEPKVGGELNAGVDDGRWGVPRKVLFGLNVTF